MGRRLPLVVGFLFLRSDHHSFDECQRQQAIAAQRCFDDTHMQEPLLREGFLALHTSLEKRPDTLLKIARLFSYAVESPGS